MDPRSIKYGLRNKKIWLELDTSCLGVSAIDHLLFKYLLKPPSLISRYFCICISMYGPLEHKYVTDDRPDSFPIVSIGFGVLHQSILQHCMLFGTRWVVHGQVTDLKQEDQSWYT